MKSSSFATVLIGELLLDGLGEQVVELDEVVVARDRQEFVDLLIAAFDGQPAVENEVGALVGLQVDDAHAVQVPGLGGARARVVVPDAQEGERTERLVHAHDEVAYAARLERLASQVAQAAHARVSQFAREHEAHLARRAAVLAEARLHRDQVVVVVRRQIVQQRCRSPLSPNLSKRKRLFCCC